MKGLPIWFGVMAIIFLTIGPPFTEAMFDNICRFFGNGKKIRDPYSCDSYVICNNDEGTTYKCPDGKLFSIDKSDCITSTAGCEDPCAPDYDSIWAADPKSCNGYYYCRNGTGSFGVCPNDLHFDEDNQQCVYATETDCDEDNYCHIVPAGIKFKNKNTCAKYNYCKSGALKTTSCSSTYFDKETEKCVAKYLVPGCDETPSGVCKNGLLGTYKNKFVTDTISCRGYYYCPATDDPPTYGQCPEGLFFEATSQKCLDPINVKCSYDRCDGRGNVFVNSNTDCMHYLICRNGFTLSEKTCTNYMFFDEKMQACTPHLITYTACSG